LKILEQFAMEKQTTDQHFLLQIDEARDAHLIHNPQRNPLHLNQNFHRTITEVIYTQTTMSASE